MKKSTIILFLALIQSTHLYAASSLNDPSCVKKGLEETYIFGIKKKLTKEKLFSHVYYLDCVEKSLHDEGQKNFNEEKQNKFCINDGTVDVDFTSGKLNDIKEMSPELTSTLSLLKKIQINRIDSCTQFLKRLETKK
jgi:hypothetical protein